MNIKSDLLAAILCLVAMLSTTLGVRADWINLTGAETSRNIAEITVLDDRVHIAVEIYIGDLETFKALIPDELIKNKNQTRASEIDRLRQFSTEKLKVVADGDEPLTARLLLAEPRLRKERISPFAGMTNPMTGRSVSKAPDDKRVLYVELEYPFQSRPKTLEITPPTDANGATAVNIGFIAYHKSVPVIDFRHLTSRVTLNLDWDDPWYSVFDNRNLKRHHKDAMMSFLYIEPYEVRHEALVRFNDLKAWLTFELRDPRYIEADEMATIKKRVTEFLLTKNPVLIDGRKRRPIVDRIDFVTVSMTGIRIVETPQRIEASTAILGVIFAFVTDGIPQEVVVDWELFTDRVTRVSTVSTDPAGPLSSFVEVDDNRHVWTNYLKTYKLPQIVETKVSTPPLRPAWLIAAAAVTVLALLFWLVSRRRNDGAGKGGLAAMAGIAIIGAGAIVAFEGVRVTGFFASNGPQATDKREAIVASLLRNVYRAFDFRQESDVYDKMSISVAGALLTDIYLQSRKSLAVQRAGGAQAKVEKVEVVEVAPAAFRGSGSGFGVDAKWSALGKVGHWGHVHTRRNLYHARLDIADLNGNWKIAGMEVLEEKRIDPYADPKPSKPAQ